jgi:hypothetical protein
MNSKKIYHSLVFVLFLAISLSLLTGCTGRKTPTPTPTPAVTEAPTATTAPSEIVYVNAQPTTDDPLAAVITAFAAENGLQFRPLASLAASDITSGTRIVVFSSEPGNLTELSTSAPTAQFVVLGNGSVTAGGNLSTIKTDPADTAFMAGYITMLLAKDWRAAALLTSDGPLGASYTDAFTNGAKFVCGKCNPYFAPVVAFPVVASEPAASDDTTWTNDAVALGDNWLSTVFIDPAAVSIPVANALSAKPINYESVTFIGTSDVPADSGLIWDALLSTDAASTLKNMLPQLLAGQGGNQASPQVILTAVNEEAVSPARQAMFDQTASDLAAGKIVPLSIP